MQVMAMRESQLTSIQGEAVPIPTVRIQITAHRASADVPPRLINCYPGSLRSPGIVDACSISALSTTRTW